MKVITHTVQMIDSRGFSKKVHLNLCKDCEDFVLKEYAYYLGVMHGLHEGKCTRCKNEKTKTNSL